MEFYELTSLTVILVLVNFTIDYLSDSEIRENELKIGLLLFLHHFGGFFALSCICLSSNLIVILFGIFCSTVVQCGFLKYGNKCWLTRYINTIINPERSNRKWRGDLLSMLEHYIHGDEVGYADDIPTQHADLFIFLSNIFCLIRIYSTY
jgi:hypothetical protein